MTTTLVVLIAILLIGLWLQGRVRAQSPQIDESALQTRLLAQLDEMEVEFARSDREFNKSCREFRKLEQQSNQSKRKRKLTPPAEALSQSQSQSTSQSKPKVVSQPQSEVASQSQPEASARNASTTPNRKSRSPQTANPIQRQIQLPPKPPELQSQHFPQATMVVPATRPSLMQFCLASILIAVKIVSRITRPGTFFARTLSSLFFRKPAPSKVSSNSQSTPEFHKAA